jgi:predicted XRE-type DNA-binding protein
METMTKHWTHESTEAFVFCVSSDFVAQLEKKIEEKELKRKELAEALQVSEGRVSQVLNDPGNLTIRKMVEYARALGMKVSVVAYEDGDPENNRGPINAEVFSKCWQLIGKPNDLFAFDQALLPKRVVPVVINYVTRAERIEAADNNPYNVMLLTSPIYEFASLEKAGTQKTLMEAGR